MLPRLALCTVLFAAAFFAACASDGSLQRVHETRDDATRLPLAGPTLAYAEAFEHAAARGAFPKRETQRDDLGRDLIAKLTALIDAQDPESPSLLAHRGVITCLLGRCEAGEADVERANTARPNAFSATWLVTRYATQARSAEVTRVCAASAPKIPEGDRFDFITRCRDALHADTQAAAMSWADPKTKSWFVTASEERALSAAQNAAKPPTAASDAEQRELSFDHKRCTRACRPELARCQSVCREEVSCLYACWQAMERCRTDCNGAPPAP